MVKLLSFTPEIQSIWQESIQKSTSYPFYTYKWHELYFSIFGQIEQPYILHIPELNTIAPFAKKDTKISFVGEEFTDYSDIVGPEEHKNEAWEQILEYCKHQGISQFFLSNIPETSSTYNFFNNQDPQQVTIEKRDTSPKILLPETYDIYMESLSRKNRHELHRKARRFNESYPDAKIETSKNPKQDILMMIQLMKLDERKKQFFTPKVELFFQNIPDYFPHDCILQILRIDNEPATAILAFRTGTEFLLYNSGFDQDRYPAAGFHLKAESINYAIREGYKEYNFLRGNERYKYDLGGRDFGVFNITIKSF